MRRAEFGQFFGDHITFFLFIPYTIVVSLDHGYNFYKFVAGCGADAQGELLPALADAGTGTG